MGRSQRVRFCTFGVVVFITAIACFLYPYDKVLPLPLAAVFGPFLGIRMGLAEGFFVLLVFFGLAFRFLLRADCIGAVLLALGIGIWAYTGFLVGTFLYA